MTVITPTIALDAHYYGPRALAKIHSLPYEVALDAVAKAYAKKKEKKG